MVFQVIISVLIHSISMLGQWYGWNISRRSIYTQKRHCCYYFRNWNKCCICRACSSNTKMAWSFARFWRDGEQFLSLFPLAECVVLTMVTYDLIWMRLMWNL